ncbi:Elongation factor 1-alpha [Corchorus olitorius]|uniref:Elongation factor 1-alpha n=1 Tax=Corchorus olitorius TaxID=93759 RepID=A0A1R3HU83_9ROSI|nr:Elongation factor 1-alpha [Corchorus olitorius]
MNKRRSYRNTTTQHKTRITKIAIANTRTLSCSAKTKPEASNITIAVIRDNAIFNHTFKCLGAEPLCLFAGRRMPLAKNKELHSNIPMQMLFILLVISALFALPCRRFSPSRYHRVENAAVMKRAIRLRMVRSSNGSTFLTG